MARTRARRSDWFQGSIVVAAALALAGCVAGPTTPPPEVAAPLAEAPPVAAAPSTSTIGGGSVKVALVVPLTGPGAKVGLSLRNAAELAFEDFQRPDLQILVKDDHGSAEGAREATAAAIAEGAELVLGPLFAPNVLSAGAAARAAGKPLIAFSTDQGVAARGVYLISFLPQNEVDRIVDEASADGRRSYAALIPDNSYGNAVEAQFREAVARRGARLAGIERYAPNDPAPAVAKLTGMVTGSGAQADALFLPGTPDALVSVGTALNGAGFTPGRVKALGTALWNDPRVLALPALQGGLFAGPDSGGFAGFSQRYQARFGAAPTRTATLGYDAISLAAALSRQYGTQRFTETTLTTPSGFAGLDGTFRFRADGTSERALAVYEVKSGTANLRTPAPKALRAPGT